MYLSNIQFDPDEEILRTVRKHWFIITIQIASVAVVAILPVFGFVALTFVPVTGNVIGAIVPHTFVTLYAGWLIICWMMLFGVWTNYYLDVWTITTKRLVTADQRGLFNRLTASFRLERLQDIQVRVHGILATLLDYGNLEAETASEDQHFVAFNIPHPQEVKALIMRTADNITFTDRPNNPVPHNDLSTNGGL